MVMDSWSEDEGTIIDISLQKPLTLSRILKKMPVVEKVDKNDKNVVVTLKSTAVK